MSWFQKWIWSYVADPLWSLRNEPHNFNFGAYLPFWYSPRSSCKTMGRYICICRLDQIRWIKEMKVQNKLDQDQTDHPTMTNIHVGRYHKPSHKAEESHVHMCRHSSLSAFSQPYLEQKLWDRLVSSHLRIPNLVSETGPLVQWKIKFVVMRNVHNVWYDNDAR